MNTHGLRILDFGCGTHKTPGSVGLDINPGTDADVIHDLGVAPYPFPDNEFDLIIGNQVIEHVEDLMLVMAELYRVAKHGAIIKLDTPHFSDIASYTDPTHRRHLSTESFHYFTGKRPDFEFYSHVRLRQLRVHVTMLKLWRLVGIELLVNSHNRFPALRFLRRFWEQYLCFVIRGKTIHYELEVIKGNGELGMMNDE